MAAFSFHIPPENKKPEVLKNERSGIQCLVSGYYLCFRDYSVNHVSYFFEIKNNL